MEELVESVWEDEELGSAEWEEVLGLAWDLELALELVLEWELVLEELVLEE